MILAQRKRHLYTWVVLGLLLPLGFGLSWQVIPQDKIEIPAKHMEFISVEYSHHGGDAILEIQIRKPLAAPGLLVLLGKKSNSHPESAILIGQINGMGLYKFQLPDFEPASKPSYLLIYNPYSKMVTYQFPL